MAIEVNDSNIESLRFTRLGSVMHEGVANLGVPEIIHFSHWRIFNDMTYSLITNHPEFSVLFFKNKFYRNTYDIDPIMYNQGVVFYNDLSCGSGKNDFMEIKKLSVDRYDFKPDIVFVEKGGGFSDFYCFGTKGSFEPIYSFYLNRLKEISLFIENFKVLAKNDLDSIYRSPFYIPDLDSNLGREDHSWVKVASTMNSDRAGLSGGLCHLQRLHGLTTKELAVASSLMSGYGQKEISILMNVSPRTVEKHVANLKRKMGCRSVIHLVSVLSKLGAVDGWG